MTAQGEPRHDAFEAVDDDKDVLRQQDNHNQGVVTRKREISNVIRAITADERRDLYHPHKTRHGALHKLFKRFSETATYRGIIIFMTIFALFSFDVTLAFLPQTVDQGLIIALSVVCGLFAFDMYLNFYLRRNYFMSFYFILDVIGTLSLIPDIVQLYEWSPGEQDKVQDLQFARAGRAGRLARSAGTLRLAKFARFFRIVRLVRVVRIFRVLNPYGPNDEDPGPAKPSRIGTYMSDLITKRVIMIVIVLILTIPQLEYAPEPHTNLDNTMYLFGRAYANDPISFRESLIAETFVHLHKDNGLRYFQVADFEVLNIDPEKDSEYRLNELKIYLSTSVAEIDQNILETYTPFEKTYSNLTHPNLDVILQNATLCEFDVKQDVAMQAVYQMLLAVLIICVFVFGSFAISHEMNIVIVKPIERMTVVLRKLAGTVFALTMIEDQHWNDHDSDFGSDDEDDVVEDMETELLEQIVSKMADVFNVSTNSTKRLPTGSTVVPLESYQSMQARKHHGPSEASVLDQATTRIQMPDGSEEPLAGHPELCSLTALLRDPKAAHELKLYMNQTLNIENFLFWQEVERFQSQFMRQAEWIYRTYVSSDAVSEINIKGELRAKIQEEIYGEKSENVRIGCFTEAQDEVFHLINHHVHPAFLSSPFCVRYLIKKRKRMGRVRWSSA